MKKEFVTYELALRMKQLGFDEPHFGLYGKSEANLYKVIGDKFDVVDNIHFIKAPTFSQAFRWFRDKYNIFPEIVTDCTTEPKFCYTYTRFFGNQNDLSSEEWGWENNIGQYSLLHRIYEEAELACLEKLIEIIEQKEK
jgi:hypothetical protein